MNRFMVRGQMEAFDGATWVAREMPDYVEVVMLSPETWVYDEYTYVLFEDMPVRYIRQRVELRPREVLVL